MSFGIYQVSTDLDYVDREYQDEILNIVRNVYEHAFTVAQNEYISTGRISKSNQVSEWYHGVLNDGTEFEIYVVIKELEPAMGEGFGCWTTQFRWL